jgi:hypothetical protein
VGKSAPYETALEAVYHNLVFMSYNERQMSQNIPDHHPKNSDKSNFHKNYTPRAKKSQQNGENKGWILKSIDNKKQVCYYLIYYGRCRYAEVP